MKKVITLLSVVIFLTALPHTVFAADILYRMLHADESESFKADQDAIITGQLIDRDEGVFTVKVHQVISGTLELDIIKVLDDFEYGFGETGLKPRVNDYCVMSLKKSGNCYKKAWGIFKATSSDYQTLKLLSKDIKYPFGQQDIAALEWYINSGGTEKDFFFSNDTVFVNRPNGEELKIYPKENTESEQNIAQVNYNKPNLMGTALKVLVAIFIVMITIYIMRNKRN